MADILAFVMPILLIVPNIALDITEPMTWWAKLLNIIVPLSFYGFLFSICRQTCTLILLLIPMMCFAGFQIVLLYLYGSSIIGVDMFLNVVTTNMAEVNELLGNLLVAIGIILILYLPPLVLSIIGLSRGWRLSNRIRRVYVRLSGTALVCSLIAVIVIKPIYNATDDLYPVNIFKNLYLAYDRTCQVHDYPVTSADFKYGAVSTHNPDLHEVYVLIIGETSRAANWELGGYERHTNPLLSQRTDISYFPKAVTQSNTTHKSVPLMLSGLTAENFNSINRVKSIISAFKEAGFHTSFFSNQKRNHSYTELFSREADKVLFLPDTCESQQPYDSQLLSVLKSQICDSLLKKQFIVLHTYGSHFNYRDRYPDSFSYFKPDDISNADSEHRTELLNAFDNTIRYVDYIVDSSINMLDSIHACSALIYAPDHGEDIFDDDRNRFLHASPVPTYYQLHVPMIMWLSNEFNEMTPDKKNILRDNSLKTVSPSVTIFHSLLDIAGIESEHFDIDLSVLSDSYSVPELLFVNDRNESVKMNDTGLKKSDTDIFRKLRII